MERYLSEFPEEPCVIVVEDDISFEFAADWPKPMKAYIEQANAEHPGWRVIQLGGIVCERSDLAPPIICKDRAVPRIRTNWFSTVGYAITREAAKDFVGWYHRTGGVVDLGELVHDQCTCVHPEFVIYSRPRSTLFAPLFSFIGTDSDLNPSNPIAHSIGRGYLLHYWGTVVK
jgi:GR25 family glycosyltransferase involved in LPS biosynthesis